MQAQAAINISLLRSEIRPSLSAHQATEPQDHIRIIRQLSIPRSLQRGEIKTCLRNQLRRQQCCTQTRQRRADFHNLVRVFRDPERLRMEWVSSRKGRMVTSFYETQFARKVIPSATSSRYGKRTSEVARGRFRGRVPSLANVKR